jgi:hypothetical protein
MDSYNSVWKPNETILIWALHRKDTRVVFKYALLFHSMVAQNQVTRTCAKNHIWVHNRTCHYSKVLCVKLYILQTVVLVWLKNFLSILGKWNQFSVYINKQVSLHFTASTQHQYSVLASMHWNTFDWSLLCAICLLYQPVLNQFYRSILASC